MKKVLALIVAFALCFTAFAGCFATSAAPVTGYAFDITAADDDLTSDGGDVVVTVSGKYTTIDTAQYLVVTLPENVTFKAVKNGVDGDTFDESTNLTDNDVLYKVEGQDIRFLEAYEPDVDFAIEITVNVPAYSEEATNEYVIEANAQVATFDAASSEDITTIEDSVTITVPAPVPEHTCTYGELQYKVEDGNCITYQECTDETCEEADKIVASVVNGAFSHYPVFESGLVLKFAPKDQTIFTKYSDVYAYFVKDNYDVNANGSVAAAATTQNVVAENNGTRDEFIFNGIFSYDMCNNINIKVFGTDANGNNVLILTEDYSMKAYIDTAYNSYVTNNNKVKADFVCDLASYGAASQLHFKRNIDNLPTAGLDLENYGTENLAVGDFVISETVADGSVIQSGDFTFNRAAVFEDKISLNIRFPKANCSEGAYLRIDFVDYANEADYVIYTADMFNTNPSNTSQYLVNFSDLRAIELHGKYNISLCAADGSVIATCAYSYDTYAWQATNSASTAQTMKDLANRVVCYGRSTRKYFGYN